MDRASIYFMNETDKNTYDYDELLPPLPLPELRDTMQRYYECLRPFGSAPELAHSRAVIADFEQGVGAKLHALLRERASRERNWLDAWWDKYGYLMLRMPLNPYIVMAMPLKLEPIGIPETANYLLKNMARISYYTLEFWDLLHRAAIKPLSSNGGKIKYSSNLYRRFFSTSRVPGEEYDRIEKHFRTASEGDTPTHGLITGKGRLFIVETRHPDGSILTQHELLVLYQRVRSILDYEPLGDCVAVLTHDERTSWAKNYQLLREVSPANKDTLKLIESANIVVAMDEHEPQNYEEISQVAINGDYHSKWGDRSSTIVCYKNGKFGLVGEHSAYDGTISVSYALFIQLSLMENPEPDWNLAVGTPAVPLRELTFDLNDTLRQEIQRMVRQCDDQRTSVLVAYTPFEDYGKEFMKENKLHPDSFVQVVMQLTYKEMHQATAPTYETALMRHYYKGRTETLRSCTTEVHKFLEMATDASASPKDIVAAFRRAVEHHNDMMNEARKGHGVDRHLFGLWCVAFENGMDIPDFYADPLYAKSGGGGNYVLSTSTLGYTPLVGFVAPMVLDGYGVFYSITSDAVFILTSAYRDSTQTSAHKFNETFKATFRRISTLLKAVKNSNL